MDETKDFSEGVNDNASDEENKSAISADLIRGHINTIILRTLYERDKYGYEIIEEIEKKSHGQYSLKQPTLYSALKRLESQGYINAYWKTDEVSLGGRRKYYTLTDSGREITEKNQAEWEYSRTVIDNLISDRSFDFSQPAPTAVDFKILKKSTSRVPVVREDSEDDDDEFEDEAEKKDEVKNEIEEVKANAVEEKKNSDQMPEIEIKPETVTFTEQVVYYENPAPVSESAPPVVSGPAATPAPEAQSIAASDGVKEVPVAVEERISADETPSMDEEQRRIVHENYLRLISEPVAEPPKEVDVVPIADDIDTDKLMYNNKPETERDYRNLINNLFDKTLKRNPKPAQAEMPVHTYGEERPAPVPEPAPVVTVKIDDISVKANNDGLKVNTSDYVVNSRRKNYNRGSTLFKCSLIVSIILMLEFMFTLLFRKELGVNGVSLAYPFVIFAIAAAQLLIFGVLYYTDLGKNSRKPSSNIYLSACIIVTIISIFIIFLVSILLNVNFGSAGDIFAKIVIPCLVALNIPIFAVCFYAFSK